MVSDPVAGFLPILSSRVQCKSPRREERDERCALSLVHHIVLLLYCVHALDGWMDGPATGNTATSTAGMVPASRTLESHNISIDLKMQKSTLFIRN